MVEQNLQYIKPVFRVIVDRKLLDGLKRRMFRAYPNEHIEAILGTIQYAKGFHDDMHTTIVNIHAFDKIKQHQATNAEVVYYYPDDSIELGTKLKYLGTVHSHPDPQTIGINPRRRCMCYSQDDVKSFFRSNSTNSELISEIIMGIGYIRLQKARKFFGITFFNKNLKKVELIIADGNSKK